MLKKTIFLLVITAIIIFAGCNKTDSPVSPNQSDVLIPLKVGNMWVSKNLILGSISLDTAKIVRDTTINGEIWYSFDEKCTFMVINRNNGFYMMIKDSLKGYQTSMDLKYPINIGDEWIQDKLDSNQIPAKCTLLSKNDVITVKAGTFSCYKYQFIIDYKDSSWSLYDKTISWVCPGIGPIKSDDSTRGYFGDMQLFSTSELQSYELK